MRDVVDKSRAKVDHVVSDATEGVKNTGRGFFGGVKDAARSVGRTLRIIGDKTECELSETSTLWTSEESLCREVIAKL